MIKSSLTVILIMSSLLVQAQDQDPFITDFLSKWENAYDYTIDFANAMPADLYGYKPTEDQRDFKGQLTHICGNIIWLSTSFLGGDGLTDANLDDPPTTKEGVIDLVNKTFNYAAETAKKFDTAEMNEEVNFFAGPMSKRRIFFLLMDHVTHHRGQLAVYLRLNDIEPARYRGW